MAKVFYLQQKLEKGGGEEKIAAIADIARNRRDRKKLYTIWGGGRLSKRIPTGLNQPIGISRFARN
jgi:hypothetical protein